jgi:hypothetical protein
VCVCVCVCVRVSKIGRLNELCDKLPRHCETIFRVAVCHTFGMSSSYIYPPTFCSPSVYDDSCHLPLQALWGTFEAEDVDISDTAWATGCPDHFEPLGLIGPLVVTGTLRSYRFVYGGQGLTIFPMSAAHSGLASRLSHITPCCDSPTATTVFLQMWKS